MDSESIASYETLREYFFQYRGGKLTRTELMFAIGLYQRTIDPKLPYNPEFNPWENGANLSDRKRYLYNE